MDFIFHVKYSFAAAFDSAPEANAAIPLNIPVPTPAAALLIPATQKRVFGFPARRLVTISTTLLCLHFRGYKEIVTRPARIHQ